MNTVFFDVTPRQKEILEEMLGGEANSVFYEEKFSLENLDKAKDAEVLSVFVSSEVRQDAIDKLPNLKYIVTRSTGFDHIDVEYCHSKGILVLNVPSYGSKTVAEYAFALLVSLSRKISEAIYRVKKEDNFSLEGLQGFDLAGKTLGVIGAGRIGKNAVKIAKGFDMNVVAYDIFKDEEFAKTYNMEYKELNDLLAVSDIITLHAPCTKENTHLINKENIKYIKKGAYLINTARGELVDTEALVLALEDGTLAGAGMDVLEKEREMKVGAKKALEDSSLDEETRRILELNKKLIGMPNVMITAHNAFNSTRAEQEILKTSADNVIACAKGEPINLVK